MSLHPNSDLGLLGEPSSTQVPTIGGIDTDTKGETSGEPINVPTVETDYMDILSAELELTESHFESCLESIDTIIELLKVDPRKGTLAEKKYMELVRKLRRLESPDKVSVKSSNIFQLEKKFQHLYRSKLAELKQVQKESYGQVSKNFESRYDLAGKNEQYLDLQKSLGSVRKIEIDGYDSIDLNCSKDEMIRILELEKKKRGKLSFENDELYSPEIKELNSQYEKWGRRNNELKRFLTHDIEEINKKVQLVKRVEGI